MSVLGSMPHEPSSQRSWTAPFNQLNPEPWASGRKLWHQSHGSTTSRETRQTDEQTLQALKTEP